jgi:hypothetical protein
MAKQTPRRAAAPTTRIKTAVYLSPAAYQRLGLASLSETKSQSDVVEWLINRYLSGYVMSVRGKRLGISKRSDKSEAQADLSKSSAA